jgi:hypothetical protein
MEDSEIIKNFLRKKGILNLDKHKQLVEVVKAIAEIPWGEGRSIEEALLTKKVGTCTGKHLVLQACFDELGIKYKPIVCTFRWIEQGVKYPEDLKKILNEGSWEHGHNFVQIEKEGRNIDLDITWNSKLKLYGFKTFPSNWDGKTDFIGVDKIIRRWDGVSIGSMKKELIESLEPEVRERREKFLKKFIEWIDSINTN